MRRRRPCRQSGSSSVPDGVTTRQAAAAMLQGMTAHYLACSTYPLEAGRHLPRARGRRRRRAAPDADRQDARRARLHDGLDAGEGGALAGGGCRRRRSTTRRRTSRPRRGASRGAAESRSSTTRSASTTFEKSLASLAPRGMLVLFGQSSGPVGPFDPQVLAQRGSLYLTRPSLFVYIATRSGAPRARGRRARLGPGRPAQAADRTRVSARARRPTPHRALEGRTTTGKVLLTP